MSAQNNIQELLAKNPIVPVVAFGPNDKPVEFAEYLIAQNIRCIEITLRTAEAIPAIKLLKKNFSKDIAIGVGTVVSIAQINEMSDLEVDFMVSPGLNQEMIKAFEASQIPFLPGVATPSDIIHAQNLGLNTLKFFPANLFGGLKALKTYAAVFPRITFCPTGGINKETYQDYLQLNNIISVGGSWIQNDFKNLDN